MFTETVQFLQKAVVFHPDGARFLALKRSASDPKRPLTWDLPGGNVEYGEQHDHALRREMREETGLEVVGASVAQVVTRYEPGRPYRLFIGHTCQATDTAVILSEEHSGACWVDARGFLSLPSAPFLRTFVGRVFETS